MQAYSLDLRQRIVAAVKGGLSQKEAAQRFSVSPASVSRYLARGPAPQDLAPKKPQGKAARLSAKENEAAAQRWQEHIQNHPHATIVEHQQWLAEQGVRLCCSAVHANLRRSGYTHKKSPSSPKSATPTSAPPSEKRLPKSAPSASSSWTSRAAI